MVNSMGRNTFACYALLLTHYTVNMEKEPDMILVPYSFDYSRRQMEVLRVVNARKEVFVTHKLMVIEELNSYEYYASSDNKSGTSLIAFEIFWPS